MVKYLDNNNSGFAMWNANRSSQKKKSTLGGFLWWLVIFMAMWWALGVMFGKNTNVMPADTTQIVEADVSKVPTYEISSDTITAKVQGLRISNIDLRDFKQNAKRWR